MFIWRDFITKIFVIQVVCFLICIRPVASQEADLRIEDVLGTWQFVRYEAEREDRKTGDDPEQLEWIYKWGNDRLILAKDYYIIGILKEDRPSYQISKIPEERMFNARSMLSDYFDLFSEYPRQFDSCIRCGGHFWLIELFDINAIVIYKYSMYMLFKRVPGK
jgi:hypothetical protein